MARHSIAPGYLKIRYNGDNFIHSQTLPVRFDEVPTPGTEPTLLTLSGAGLLVTVAFADYLPVVTGLMAEDSRLIAAEVHAYDDVTEVDQFIYGFSIDQPGLNGAVVAQPAVQLTMSFKTILGNLYRWYLMEPSVLTGVNSTDFSTPATITDLRDYFFSPTCFIWGRDGNEMFSPIRYRTKVNDALRAAKGL